MSGGESSANGLKNITPESLALSASLFTSSIDSWVPKDFGVVKSDTEKKREFESAFSRPVRGVESVDRLGLGHPLLSVQPSNRPNGSSAHNSLTSLARHLNSKKTLDEGPSGTPTELREEEEEDEEESRSRSLGKGKGKMKATGPLDPFAGKKKKKKAPEPVLEPDANGAGPSRSPLPEPSMGNASEADGGHEKVVRNIPSRSQTSSPGGSGEFPFPGPVSIPVDFAPRTKKRKDTSLDPNPSHVNSGAGGEGQRAIGTDEKGGGGMDGSPEIEETGMLPKNAGEGGVKSKTQLRRDKRKRRKLEQRGNAS